MNLYPFTTLVNVGMLVGLLSASPQPATYIPTIDGPLHRTEPRIYDLTFGVTLSTEVPFHAHERKLYVLKDSPIVMPVIVEGPFNLVEKDSISSNLWLGDREANPRRELRPTQPAGTHLAVMFIDEFEGQTLRWEVNYRAQVWSSQIDDEKAIEIAWPDDWPEGVAFALKPQMFIESDDPIFKQKVNDITQGNLRNAPPYLAARELIRQAINEIQVTGDGEHRGFARALHGMDICGAKLAWKNKRGSPHDLVCVCVAMLRAAEIPARPVIGVHENEKDREEFVTWAEFYLPEAGWIPFDPNEMRGKGIHARDVHQPWPEFGTMDDLNRRIPLAYHFIPSATVESPMHPAVWGWDPRPYGDPGSEQFIKIGITSRGRAKESGNS